MLKLIALNFALASATFVSLTDHRVTYTLCKPLPYGGSRLVVVAVRSSETCANGPTVIIKCDTEGVERESELLRSFESTRYIYVDTVTRSDSPDVCLVMRHLGASLEQFRDSRVSQIWTWPTVASIGLILVNAVEEFHSRGFAHSDLHSGNVLFQSPGDISRITPIDVGSMVRLDEDPKRGPMDCILDDLKQIIVSLRFLVDGDRQFFAAKRFDFRSMSTAAIAGAPEPYAEALVYLYSIKSMEEIDYERIKHLLRAIIRTGDREFAGNAILW